MPYPVFYQGEIHIDPSLTPDHEAVVSDFLRIARTERTSALFAAIAARPEAELPAHSGLLEVSATRAFLFPEEGESRAGVLLWLTLVSQHFFGPMEYQLNGQVFWEGPSPRIAAASSSKTTRSKRSTT